MMSLESMLLRIAPPVPTVPRLPVVPDPLRRARIPRDLDAVTTVGVEADPRDCGMTADAVARIWRSVEALYRSGIHPAIAVCLRRDGHVVLDRAIGHATGNGPGDPRGAPPVLATPDTPFCIFSTSKAITAMVIHLLDQRGLIHIDDRVCEYIPEFARHGKDAITIAHVLSHRAGVPQIPREALDLRYLDDREFQLQVMCDAKPSSRPGTVVAYHAISGGFVLAEIVRRVMGKAIRDVLAEEILQPLGFRWGNYGVAPQDLPLVARSYATGPPILPPLSLLVERVLGVRLDQGVELVNDPRFLTGVIPSGNIVTTANELSRFFELLRAGGQVDGVRIFEERTIRRAITEQAYHRPDLMLALPLRWSLGFLLGARWLSVYGPDTEMAFGHVGFMNVLGWADPERALSGALITSGKPLVYPEIAQFWGIMRRIAADAPKVARHLLSFEPTTGPGEVSG
jgi:CubicO group peptidase (beta-lactamase class C family)